MAQVIYKRHSRAMPETLGRFAAGSSLLLAPLLSWLLLFRGENLVQGAAAREMVSALEVGDLQASEKALEVSLSRPKYAGWLTGSFANNAPERLQAYERLAHLLFKTHLALVQGNTAAAKEAFQAISPDDRGTLLTHAGGEDGLILSEKLSKNFSAWEQNNLAIKKAQQELATNKSELSDNRDRFITLRSDFAAILSTRANEPLGDDLEMEIYSNGILAGVPLISGVPGDATDLLELKKSLDSLGLRVRTESNNPHQEFLSKIESTRDTAKMLIEIDKRNSSKLKETIRAKILRERRAKELLQNLGSDLKSALELLVRESR